MQLNRWMLALWVVALTCRARADDDDVEASVRTMLYQDSDSTTISTSAVEASGRFARDGHVGARYLIDVVSSASVDVVTQATARFEDVRHEVGASAGYRALDGGSLIANYAYSTENDWTSHNAGVSGSVDVFGRNVTLAGSLGAQFNTITQADTFGFRRELGAALATLSASVIATPEDLFQLAVALSYYDGFQASPYRFLTVRTFGYAEAVPSERLRSAAVLRHHRYLGEGFALRTHARAYVDTFGIESLTLGTELAYEEGPLALGAWVRAYGQTGASFYREAYPAQQTFMSNDKELSAFADVFVGGSVAGIFTDVAGFEELRIEGRAAAFYFYYFEFARLEQRVGFTLALSAGGRY